MLGTKVMLKQWKSEAAMLSSGENGLVRGRDHAKEVSVVVVPVQSGIGSGHCICFRGKDSKSVLV